MTNSDLNSVAMAPNHLEAESNNNHHRRCPSPMINNIIVRFDLKTDILGLMNKIIANSRSQPFDHANVGPINVMTNTEFINFNVLKWSYLCCVILSIATFSHGIRNMPVSSLCSRY